MAERSIDQSESINNEACWILVGRKQSSFWLARLVQPSEGNPTQVAFDHAWVIDRDQCHADIIGFLHTHPSGSCKPSQRDVDTMQAWTSCLGKPLLCLIATQKGTSELHSKSEMDGRLKLQCIEAYLFDDDLSIGTPFREVEVFDVDANTEFPSEVLVVVRDCGPRSAGESDIEQN